MADPIFDLAETVVNTNYEDIPQKTAEVAKRFVLDTLGVAIAGSTAPGCEDIIDQLAYWGGRPESTVLVYGYRLPSLMAAFANATMVHARDFDDTHDAAVLHSYAPIFPAALAVAEAQGNVPGKQLIAAVTLGVDMACRLSLASPIPASDTGWHLTATLGVFGATAAVGKILRLDLDQMVNALGIAYSQVAGNLQCIRDGALTKRMQPGFSAKAGVLSAYMAQRGIVGARNILEGFFGYFKVYQHGRYDLAVLRDGLGQRFELSNLSAKPYPCCRYNHAGIDVTLQAVAENGIEADEVEEVILNVPPITQRAVGQPFVIAGNPQVAAQFSLIYTAAAALLRKDVLISDFEEHAIRDPRVLDMTKKIRVISNGMSDSSGGFAPVAVTIKTRRGTFSKRMEAVKGDPNYPMTDAEFLKKFRSCIMYAAKPLDSAKVDRAIEAVLKLEQVDDVGEVVGLLA